MDGIKILIAGLPNAGKTTYIAALNGAIQTGGNFSLSYAGKTSERYRFRIQVKHERGI